MTRKYNSFEEWASANPAPLVCEPAPPDMPMPDPVAAWRWAGEARERQRTEAKAELKAIEERTIREHQRHEIRMSKAAANGKDNVIDWAAVLPAIADGFNGVANRLDKLELRIARDAKSTRDLKSDIDKLRTEISKIKNAGSAS